MLSFIAATARDEVAFRYLTGKWDDPDVLALVSHGSHDAATVPAGDLVRQQHVLPDGRLLRVDATAPESKGALRRVFITVEALPDPTVQPNQPDNNSTPMRG